MVSVNLYSENSSELKKFLVSFFNLNGNKSEQSKFLDIDRKISNLNTWEHQYTNPIEISEIIAAYIDNSDKYKFDMWVSLDSNVYISVTEENANNLIKYLFERYPY